MFARMAARISLIYVLFGLAWISGSTLIVWADTRTGPVAAEVIKGIGFVLITSVLIYWLVRRGERQLEGRNRQIGDLHTLLQSILDGSADMIGAWDRQGRYTALNPRLQSGCERLFGVTPQLGTTLDDLVGHIPDRHQEFRRCWDRTLAGDSFVEMQSVDLNGETFWYETSYGCLRGADRAIVGGLHVIRDTTARRRVEHALQERERRLQAIVDNLADYVVIIDPDLTCQYRSAGFTRVTGCTAQDGLGEPMDAYIHPDDVATVRRRVSGCLATGQRIRDLEYRRRHVDGRWHHHILSGGRLEQGGTYVFLAVVQNVDERKQAEARLAHSAKLATVGEFAAGLAHELAHPVAVIRLAAESALDHVTDGDDLDPFLCEQIELVDDQVKRMASMIEHIRAFSRKSDLPETTFSAQSVVQAVDRMVRKQLEIDGITLNTAVCSTDRPIIGNPLRLEEVVLNLISNARAAIRARRLAEPSLHQGEIELSCHCGDEVVEVRVGDNGIGIAPADSNRVFESFFTTKEVGEGLGLGLAISLTIVKSFGGQLTFTSRPGDTRFVVSLPIVGALNRSII